MTTAEKRQELIQRRKSILEKMKKLDESIENLGTTVDEAKVIMKKIEDRKDAKESIQN